jgi:hypothetical protein
LSPGSQKLNQRDDDGGWSPEVTNRRRSLL